MFRFFGKIENNQVRLSDKDIRKIKTVLRGKIGDSFQFLSNDDLYLIKISKLEPLSFTFEKIENGNHELKKKITLYLAPIKGDHLDFAIQKSVELGVNEIVFLNTKRVVRNIEENRLTRYEKIIYDAASQSKRNIVPVLKKIVCVKDLKLAPDTYGIFCYEKEDGSKNLIKNLSNIKEKNIAVLIGPEGGFEKDEVDLINSLGFNSVSLGNRILRADTSALYIMSILSTIYN